MRRETGIVEGKNMGQFYRFCNNKLNTRSSVGAIRKSNGELTSDPKEKAEMLNENFSSVFTIYC